MSDRLTWRRRLLTGLCWFIALQLFLFAPFKFSPVGFFGYPSYPEKFVAWGYPAWFSFVVGGWEIFAAVMLVLRADVSGRGGPLFILTGAIATHIINHDSLTDSIAAPVVLVLAAIVALTHWPADWREPLAFRRREPERVLARSQHEGRLSERERHAQCFTHPHHHLLDSHRRSCLGIGLGGVSDLMRLQYVRVIVAHLGYPPYLLGIIGFWKVLAAIVLLVPRFPVVKEWAYAGSFFVFTGAAASHMAGGDGFEKWIGPAVGAAVTAASWALRPPSRRVAPRLGSRSFA